jgi:hypothetical protein
LIDFGTLIIMGLSSRPACAYDEPSRAENSFNLSIDDVLIRKYAAGM